MIKINLDSDGSIRYIEIRAVGVKEEEAVLSHVMTCLRDWWNTLRRSPK